MEEQLGHIKLLKEDLGNSVSIVKWIVWRLSQQYRMMFWVNFKFIENLTPYSLHCFPIPDYAMLNGITQLDESSIFLLEYSYGRSE